MSDSNHTAIEKITIEGFDWEWYPRDGLFLIAGQPVLAAWIETTLAGMMLGMQRMVGVERFNLSMQSGGRDSVDGDWAFIWQSDTFERGFAKLADLAVTCGWGYWKLVSIDRDKREAVFTVINSWEVVYQRGLGVCWGTNMIAGKFAGICSRLFEVNCWATQTKFQAGGDDIDEFIVKPSADTVEERINRLLETDQATRADLAVALEQLKRENAERRRAEREAQDRLAMIDKLSTPILQVWDGVLALPVLGTLSGDRATTLMDRLLAEIQRTQSPYAILDVTGVDVIDTHTADHLLKVARAVELLGARCIITGIQPAVAQTMVNLQSSFSGMVTLATLRDGIKYCMGKQAVR